MRVAGVPFYQAHTNNFTRGRERAVRYITIHHSAGWEDTLRYLWANPSRNGSSHFWVGNNAGQIEQYVDTDDTAWTNGNWVSNTESITIETRGDWRGYFDQTTLNNLKTLLVALRKAYPNTAITYHKDVSSTITLCPADLKDKGYAKLEWDKASAILAGPAPTPTPPASSLSYERITPKRVILNKATRLWDFNFNDWASAKPVGEPYPAGWSVDVVAIGKNSLGGRYYMTAYSFNEGNIRATNGFNVADANDYVPAPTPPNVPDPVPPTPVPTWLPLDNPRKLRTTRELYVINLDTMANQGTPLASGTDIDIVEKITLADNKMYYRSKWARDNAKNWGVPADSMTEVPSIVPTPEVPPETVPETPIDTDPNTAGNSDIVVRLNLIEAFLKAISDFFSELFKNFPLFKK